MTSSANLTQEKLRTATSAITQLGLLATIQPFPPIRTWVVTKTVRLGPTHHGLVPQTTITEIEATTLILSVQTGVKMENMMDPIRPQAEELTKLHLRQRDRRRLTGAQFRAAE